MNRPIKFRVWDEVQKVMHYDIEKYATSQEESAFDILSGKFSMIEVMQFTGLLDKNGLQDVYEGDIVDVYGKIIGNKYETPMVKGDSPIIIEGLGTSTWSETEKAGLARGLKYAE